MDYAKISPEVINHLYAGHHSLKHSSITKELRILLEIRVSEINNCSYCYELHRNEWITSGFDKNKIDNLDKYENSNLFTNAEKEVLNWAESLTKLEAKRKVTETELKLYYSEQEIVDITICISMMNMFNRIAISMR